MAKTKISDYSTTNSSNTDINSINIDEGCAPSGINNAIREVMVHLKNWQTNASGDGATFASLVVQGTGSFTGAVTMSAGATLSGTNTLSGSNIISGNINSSGTNTFSGTTVMSGSNSIGHAAGTSASPSIYFSSDTNTGIFSPTADNVAVATGGSERVRVDSSGNVGIGTSSPNFVNGGGKYLDVNGGSSRGNISILTDATNADGTLMGLVLFGATTQTAGHQLPAQIYGELEGATANQRGGRISFYTKANASTSVTERMRIDSSGNVGLGVTPSAWDSGYKFFETQGGSFGTASATRISLFQNAYVNGGVYKYKTTAAASWYYQDSGSHWWASASSGTAGNTITWTTVLNLDKGKTLALEGATSQTGTGITFPATQSASSDANTLDDYEQGSFTATMTPQTSGTITLTANERTLIYTKIGRQVTVTGAIIISSVSSPVGTFIKIATLPFLTGGTGWNYRAAGSVAFYDDSATTYAVLPFLCVAGTDTSLYLIKDASTVAANDQFYISITYMAAD